MSTLIDLSHTVEHGMTTYPGLPAPVVRDHMSHEASRSRYAEGTEIHIGAIEMVANTGTYIDSPFHRFRDAGDLSELPLESIAELPGVVVRAHRPGPPWDARGTADAAGTSDAAGQAGRAARGDRARRAVGAGIPVVEHMRGLNALPDAGFRFFAVPVKVKGLGSFPVRCFAVVDG